MFSISPHDLSWVEDEFAKNFAPGDFGNDLWLESPKTPSPAVQATCFILASVSYSSLYISMFGKAVCFEIHTLQSLHWSVTKSLMQCSSLGSLNRENRGM